MMTNIIIFIPKILITHRFEGTLMGILIAIPIGFFACIVFCKAISKFPEQGLPEIIDRFINRKVKIGILLLLSCSWMIAGLLTLLGFIDIVNRFINPEISKVFLIMIFLVAICFVLQLPTQKIMYLLEIIMFINVPLIMFIIFKSYTSDYLSWDSVYEVGTHIFERPNYKAIAAATFTFSGFENIIIFNRLFKNEIKMRNFIVVLLLAIFTIFTSFFIPIGILGADSVNEFLYPWISTSDSLRIIYGPIERVIFLFLMFYISITLISVSVHWHVAFELVKGIPKGEIGKKMKWVIFAIVGCITIIVGLEVNALQIIKIAENWLIGRLGIKILIVILIFFLARRVKKCNL
jgi:spore germination protein KB